MKTCKSCVFINQKKDACHLLDGQKVNPEKDVCPKHETSLLTCMICGNVMPKAAAIIEFKNNDELRILCTNCYSKSNTCQGCKHGNECVFETDPSPIPKVIEKVMRQGPVTTVTQVANPERIAETCKKSCPCYDPENGCLKQFNTCGKCENL